MALRLIVEREREVASFKPVEYWTLDAQLHPEGRAPQSFTARLTGIDGKRATVETVNSPALPDGVSSHQAVAELEKAQWSVRQIERKQRKRNPSAPFTTSQLQQDSSRKLGFNVKRTMGVAQRLYEGVEVGAEGLVGLITYMRTDSPRCSPESIQGAREWIQSTLGPKYLPAAPNASLQREEGFAGRARSDSPDRREPYAGVNCALSERRATEDV